ncbi:hypothetical protein VHEMI02997 [[Torrubiella] hemipterigena]|uniref:Peptidase S53 domain-containing protein n=1 Tax=[Torrubiella] hemipterigena TaxID=1531966 RepID=A0A0A1T9T7_9HYPO|nr:hypothetical protein VHEMI02997 [[Torrubiella] hemipterigena]
MAASPRSASYTRAHGFSTTHYICYPPTFVMLTLAQATILAWMTVSVSAAPALGSHAVLEAVNVPHTWTASGAPKPDTKMRLQIGLKQQDMAGLEKRLMEISDHTHADYGKWLSKEDMAAYTSPSAETLRLVKSWLEEAGVAPSAIGQAQPDWVHVDVDVATAEKLLGTQYSVYKNTKDTSSPDIIRTSQYSVPKALHGHIDTIQPTTSFAHGVKASRSIAAADADASITKRAAEADKCNDGVARLACMRKKYNVNYSATGKATIAIAGFIGQYINNDDTKVYLEEYDPTNNNTVAIKLVGEGENNPNQPGGEASMDVQLALGFGHGNPVTFYSVDTPAQGQGENWPDQLLAFIQALTAETNPPSTASISYAAGEAGGSVEYMTRACNEFMKAGARGITVFGSSGDDGVGSGDCSSRPFEVLFPASCPYMTSVGGTQWSADSSSEAVWPYSGSGFSNVFAQPDWQAADVNAYIKNSVPSAYKGRYNASGRAYPDVALVADKVPYFLNGAAQSDGGGTSASSPFWAAAVSLINDYRATKGKPALGFLNKRLYTDKAVRAAMTDIVDGSNPSCKTAGFKATVGWDSASGFGVLNFGKLKDALST